jgi:hypothetical protein
LRLHLAIFMGLDAIYQPKKTGSKNMSHAASQHQGHLLPQRSGRERRDVSEIRFTTHPLTWVWGALQIASLVHVFRESSRDKRIGKGDHSPTRFNWLCMKITLTTHAEQARQDRDFWHGQTPEARLHEVERLRAEAGKFLYEYPSRLRRIVTITRRARD